MPDPTGSTRFVRWLPTTAWMVVIFGLSSVQGSSIPSAVGVYSPVAHFTEYAVLAVLMVFALGGRRLSVPVALVLLLACSAYGASDEFHQSFVAGRTPDPVDWATDTAGAALALASVAIVRRRGRS
jgi:VanZ family protein